MPSSYIVKFNFWEKKVLASILCCLLFTLWCLSILNYVCELIWIRNCTKVTILFCSLFYVNTFRIVFAHPGFLLLKIHMILICHLIDNIKHCELIIYTSTQYVWKYLNTCFQGIVLKFNLMWHYHLSLTTPLMTKTRNLNLYYQN